jgi:hypothetical protein
MEKTAVCASADFVDDIGLEITIDRARDVFAVSCVEKTSDFVQVKLYLVRDIPVSEKKVLKPWSLLAALRSSVRYPSG